MYRATLLVDFIYIKKFNIQKWIFPRAVFYNVNLSLFICFPFSILARSQFEVWFLLLFCSLKFFSFCFFFIPKMAKNFLLFYFNKKKQKNGFEQRKAKIIFFETRQSTLSKIKCCSIVINFSEFPYDAYFDTQALPIHSITHPFDHSILFWTKVFLKRKRKLV